MASIVGLVYAIPGVIGNATTASIPPAQNSRMFIDSPFQGGFDLPINAQGYDVGVRTFDLAGDKWSDSKTNGVTALQEIADSERGLIYQDRVGIITLRNANYVFTKVANAVNVDLSNGPTDIQAIMGEQDIVNHVAVEYTPRATLATGIIAQADNVIRISGQSGAENWSPNARLNPTGGSTTVKLDFTDPQTARKIGALSVITPLDPSTDIRVNDNAAGTGFDYTNYLDPNTGLPYWSASFKITGSSIEINFKNTALGPLYVTLLKIRGVGLTTYNPAKILREDIASIKLFNELSKTINMPLPSGQSWAESVASYEVGRYKNPDYHVKAINMKALTYYNGIDLFIINYGDLIGFRDNVVNNGSAVTRKYLVTGFNYSLVAGGEGSTIMFYVRDLDDLSYGIFDSIVYGLFDSTLRFAL